MRVQDVVAGLGIAFFERHLVTVMSLYSTTYTAMYLINELLLLGTYWGRALTHVFYTVPPFAVVFSLTVVALRRLALRRSWQMVVADRARYDKVWEEMTSQGDAAVWLTAIRAEVSNLLPTTIQLCVAVHYCDVQHR